MHVRKGSNSGSPRFVAIVAGVFAIMGARASSATTAEQLCESAKVKATSSFAQCRLKADSSFAKTPDMVKREAAYGKCEAGLAKGFQAAEIKYGEACPGLGDFWMIRDYLAQCTLDVAAVSAPNGSLPNAESCAQGTAQAAHVLAGRSFTSAGGVGQVGTMANRGAVDFLPGTQDQPVPAGYHDGGGLVAGDADLVPENIRSGVEIFGVTGSGSVGTSNGLMATGQATPYGAGSDGAAPAGTEQSFIDNGDGTITDSRTGLMWEKKSNDGGLHDKDNAYSWSRDTSGTQTDGTVFTQFLAGLNARPCFAGHCDWRVPNRREIESLVNAEAYVPAVFWPFNWGCVAGCTVTACNCTQPGFYWSSTTYRLNPASAWYVNMYVGTVGAALKSEIYYIRAVRDAG